MSTSKTVVALVQVGYATYAVPISFLEHLAQLRKVESRYGATCYSYWYADAESEALDVKIIDAASILPADPGAAVAPTPITSPAAPVVDARLIGSPTDPLSIGSVPPMRDFVDEWRDQEGAA